MKLTGGVAAVGLGAAFWAFPPVGMTVRERLRVTGWAAGALAAVLVLLLAKNWLGLENPVYPLLINLFGTFDNPVYLEKLHGFGSSKDPLATAMSTFRLLFPSAAFWILAGVFYKKTVSGGVYRLLLASAVSVVTVAVAFSPNFPGRYILFLSAFQSVCTACVAGGFISQSSVTKKMRLHFSLYARIAAWAAVFLLAVWSIHLDNRLKRSIRIALGNPGLTQRILQMSAASRFQTAWRNRLPKSAEPMTFYRPERLYTLGQGWNPVVALHSPSFVRLFALCKGAAQLEKVLAKRGITHFYFETDPEEPEFSVYYDQLVARLKERKPLWRAAGYEMYSLKQEPSK